jgi:hypothetical protein
VVVMRVGDPELDIVTLHTRRLADSPGRIIGDDAEAARATENHLGGEVECPRGREKCSRPATARALPIVAW